MDDELRRRIEELFHRAVALTPEEQASFLEAECPDERVRAEVKQLLELDRLGDDPVPGLDEVVRDLGVKVAHEMPRRLGDYRLVREIGRGGMGQVFEAVQESLGRRVALKTLAGMFTLDSQHVERFQREARATARIRHPNIVPVYDVAEDAGIHFYVMEYVEGMSLSQRIAAARGDARTPNTGTHPSMSAPGSIASCVEQMASLTEGVQEAHRQGLVHRDIKPSNILVDTSGLFVLIDFGLVHDEKAETITRSGDLLGTMHYMSPEQIAGGGADERSDVYSLGVTLYELLTLRLPFVGESDLEVRRRIVQDDPTPPRKLNKRLNADLETIILHALEKDPDRRYQSAADLAADLRRFLRYEPIRAKPQTALTKIARRIWRRRFAVGAVTMICALALTTVLLLTEVANERRTGEEARYESILRDAIRGIDVAWSPRDFRDSGIGTTQGWKESLLRGPRGGIQRIEKAADDLLEAARLLPDRPDSYYYRGKALFILCRFEDSLEALDAAIELRPDLMPARVLRATIHRRLGDLAAERKEREEAREAATSELSKVWFEVTSLMPHRGYDTAAFSRLLDLFEEDGEPYLGARAEMLFGRANTRLFRGRYLPAISDLDYAAALTATLEPQVKKALAYGLWARKEGKKEATEDQIDPENILPALWSQVSEDRRDEVALAAINLLPKERGPEWAAKLQDDLLRARELATSLESVGRIDDAFEAAQEATKLARGDPVAWTILGGLHERRESWDDARRCYEESVRVDPTHRDAHHRLGTLLRREKELDGAARFLETALELSPSAYWTSAELARVYQAQGRDDESFAQFCDALTYAMSGHALRAKWDYVPAVWDHLRREKDGVEPSPEFDLLLETWEDELRLHRTGNIFHWMHENLGAVMALAWLHHPTRADAAKALKFAATAVKHTGRRELEPLVSLAEVLWVSGERGRAILTLEDVVRLAPDRDDLQEELAEHRHDLLPDAVSYASLDAAVRGCSGDDRKEDELLAVFGQVASGEDRADRIRYLEGVIARRRGELAVAREAFAEVAGRDRTRPEPHLRLAECLRSLGPPEDAEALLRKAMIGGGIRGDRDLWRLWTEIARDDLGWSYSRLLTIFSPGKVSSWHFDGTARSGPGGKSLVISDPEAEPRGIAFFKLPLPMEDLTAEFEILMDSGSGWLGGGAGIRFVVARRYEYPGWGHQDLPPATGCRIHFSTLIGESGAEHTIVISAGKSTLAEPVVRQMRDGEWHRVSVTLRRGRVHLSFDGDERIQDLELPDFESFTGYVGFVVVPGAGRQMNQVRDVRLRLGESDLQRDAER